MATTMDSHKACRGGDVERVRELVEGGSYADEVVDGSTGLQLAAAGGHQEVAEVLLEGGAGVDLAREDGATALYLAAEDGYVGVVDVLVSSGANVDVRNEEGWSPLFVAACNGHADVVTALITAGATVDLRNNKGSTPLYAAALSGRAGSAAALIAAGADVNAARIGGITPLNVAAHHGHSEVVKLLLDAGASVDAARDGGATPLDSAAWNGHSEVVLALLGAGASVDVARTNGSTPLYIAAERGHIDIVKVLIEAGASVDAARDSGATPLYIASYNGDGEIVVALLKAGANVDAAKSTGETSLYMAAGNGHLQVVNALLANGANVDTAKADGTTPLIIAAWRGHVEVVVALYAAGANPNLARCDGLTPLIGAVDSGKLKIVTRLLQAGATVDTAVADGRTALYFAAEIGNRYIIAALLEADATANLAADNGQTPLAVAFEKGYSAAAVALQQAGGQVNGVTGDSVPSVVAATKRGAASVLDACLTADEDTPSVVLRESLWWAVACGRTGCVRLLLPHVPDEVDGKLRTHVCLAAHQGQQSVLRVLIEHQPHLLHAVEHMSGKNSVAYALAAGHGDIAKWLLARGARDPRVSGATGDATSVVDSLDAIRSMPEQCEPTLRISNGLLNTILSSSASVSDAASSEVQQAATNTALSDRTCSTESEIVITPAVVTEIEKIISRLYARSNGFVLNHILPTGMLGEGAYGEVSRGNYMGQEVAFKLHKYWDTTALSVNDVTQLLEFEREACMLAVLAEPTHRHCIGFLGIAVSPDVGIAIVTAYVSGGSLRDWLHRHGHLNVVDGLTLLAGLASGLAFLHEAGTVHGDIKPENIMLEYESDDDGEGGEGARRVYGKWIDFGGGYPYWRGRTAYTPRYGAPEQLLKQPATAGSDVFSFGCVAMEVLSGVWPDSPRHPRGPPLQRNLVETTEHEAVDEAREKLADEIRRLLPTELLSRDELVNLLADCWKEDKYSRARTDDVFETLMSLLMQLDSDRAAKLSQQLLESAPPASKNSQLLTAVQYCDVETVERLVGEGARADEENRWGHTPLHVAAAIDSPYILELLLSTQPQLLQDSHGNTALDIAYDQDTLFACGVSSIPMLQERFGSEGAGTTDTPNGASSYPLHAAVARQDYAAAVILLDGGTDVNGKNSAGDTALHIATKLKESRVVELLVERGAGVNVSDMSRGWSPLHFASYGGDIASVQTLLQSGAVVDKEDGGKRTPLFLASLSGRLTVALALLDAGAAVGKATKDGFSALMCAAENGHADVVRALLDAGATVDHSDNNGVTALMLAAHDGHTDVVRILLDGGARVDRTNNNGVTALIFAAEKGHADVVRFLIQSGACVDHTNIDGWTAVMWVSGSGHTDVVKALLDAGATVDHTSDNGVTALMFAAQNGQAETVQLLVNAGANVQLKSSKGNTALFFALIWNHADVAAILKAAVA